MTPCARCHRHLRDTEATCPFCARDGLPMTVLKVTAVLLTPLVLAACYGPPRGDHMPPDADDAGKAPAADAGKAPAADAGKASDAGKP